MSLVGTRPPTVDEWDKYELHHRARLATKPGLTGMWQVSGRSNITDLFNLIVDEAEKNEEFAEALSKIFCKETPGKKIKNNTGEKRASNRRDKAILDPIKLAEDGELSVDVLLPLSEKELKDEEVYQWPRNASEVRTLTRQEYRWLLEGLSVSQSKAIKKAKKKEF